MSLNIYNIHVYIYCMSIGIYIHVQIMDQGRNLKILNRYHWIQGKSGASAWVSKLPGPGSPGPGSPGALVWNGCFLKWWYPHFTPQNDQF